ncbi:indolepyruvate ferredoxin oxidoreductase family protein [Novosphingobium sp.]|uniref:indolepyruvate ferredoxin oxidoreductase family protein n=1 Tax=Novosphingobium sp. TaxID=1874826 RepID=UPI002FDF5C57
MEERNDGKMQAVKLADRFEKRSGQILISGVQALVRLMILQAERDAANGLKTGGYVSGYRGSPLGTLDTAFAGAREQVARHHLVVQPAVNEELGATAVAGTQQIAQTSTARVDGIFALWYGKGPGLDRASDALRHGNYQGASPHGGVVLAVGDDHLAKSSSIICYSDEVVAGLQVPLFYPADVAEIVSYGLHGFAMSRHTGSYAALKIITEVADSTRAVDTEELAIKPVLPDIAIPSIGLHNRWPEMPLEQETRQIDFRLPAVAAYVRANKLDRIVLKGTGARFGLMAAGKSWLDLLEGLRLIGLDEARMASLGIALYKPALIWPLEPEGLKEFAQGLDTIIVVEEKGEFIERQAKSILYELDAHPHVWGKRGPDKGALLPATGDLTPERIASAVGALLAELSADSGLSQYAERAKRTIELQTKFAVPPVIRKPFFCSGCPHNRSTVVPDGSRALAGIGCHGLAAYNRPFTGSFAQMGGEGIHWMGLAPFTDEKHIFANMGDGTYFHSGLLAIRQAVAAGINITYKLLYNSAVAMTGGQSVDGELTVEQLVDQLRAEGIGTIILSTDDPDRYANGHPVQKKVERIEHRDDLDALQRELRERSGVSVIIYEQMCATEKRRLRKRGKMADPSTRVFINDLVCEGCGDCSVKSNCLSVEPVETAFGTKRRINQSTCNKDYSCLTGFCPSFVTVEGGVPRKAVMLGGARFDAVTLPVPPRLQNEHQRVIVSGIGGTGVVTIGALVAMSAHMQGQEVGILDQVGMAQKGGAVVSHLHVAREPVTALRIPAETADLIIVCDEIVGNSRDAMAAIEPGRTQVLANADVAITGDFTQNRNAMPDSGLLAARLRRRAGEGHVTAYPFTQLSLRLLGDAIGSNLMMVGFAWQKGWLDLDAEAFDAAIALNGTAVGMNRAAFALGRHLAVDPDAVLQAAGFGEQAVQEVAENLVARRAAFLRDYQDDAYAERYRRTVARIAGAETACGGSGDLTDTVARTLFRLMAYKDEYEVARLYTDGSFAKSLADSFEGPVKLKFHMAPPILARRDKASGELRKRQFGSWMMPVLRLLAIGKKLRGTAFDPFGYSVERKTERRLITDYEALIERLISSLDTTRLSDAVRIAGLALEIRGYGHVKDKAVVEYDRMVSEAVLDYERGSETRAGLDAMWPADSKVANS